jgi:hypothetical protein
MEVFKEKEHKLKKLEFISSFFHFQKFLKIISIYFHFYFNNIIKIFFSNCFGDYNSILYYDFVLFDF